MASRSRKRFLTFLFLGVISLAFLIDRIALYTWGLSVIRQFQRYRQSVLAASDSAHPQRPISISETTEPPLWIGSIASQRPGATDPHHDCANFLISLEPALARPDFVSVKGSWVELIYNPPPLAWTTRIFPLRPHNLSYRLYRPKDYYGYKIIANLSSPNGLPLFKLYRSTNVDDRELPPDTRFPELFP